MSLVAKRQMTDARLAAARANGKLSGGPATTEGRQRICDAHLIHGYYAQGERETLSALGEDPKDLDELREELREIWSPVNRFEEELVGRLARALWRMKRAARVQEALAAREVRKRMQVLEDKWSEEYGGLEAAHTGLVELARASADPGFETRPEDLKILSMDDIRKDVSRLAARPFSCLRHLATPETLRDMGYQNKVEPATGQDREQRRKEVHEWATNLAARLGKELAKHPRPATTLPPWERTANLAVGHRHNVLMGRMEDSSFRQVWRLSNLLLKIQDRRAREPQEPEALASAAAVGE